MAYTYKPYQDSEDTKKKYQAYDAHQATRPGEFVFNRQQDLDSARDAWQNRDAFQYNAADDGMYQQMVDRYIQQGKMAMQDTMGQAAAMTGGYGNTWAQNAGQQAYQGYLNGINDMAPQYYQMALDRYQMEGENLYNQYAALSAEEQQAYGRHMDAQNLWQQQSDALKADADSGRMFDWEQYAAGVANDQWQASMEFEQEQARIDQENWEKTFNANAASQSRQDAESRAAVLASLGDFSGYQQMYGLTDEQVKQLQDQYAASQIETPTIYKYMRQDENGNYVFSSGGKEYTYAPGINPYTSTMNSDVKYGAFSNGYQPNNIKGQKLSKSGITDVVNGVTQNVWKTPDGKLWIWDGTKNQYLEYDDGRQPQKNTADGVAGLSGVGGNHFRTKS